MMFSSRWWLHASRIFGCLVAIILLTIPLRGTGAETHAECERQFETRSGQPGKDVMWVATIDQLVTSMLRAARVTNKDRVIDLGSGDGKIPIAAARQFGATALGIEYNPQLVQLAQCYARVAGVTDKARFQQGDIFATDFSAATVLTLYLSPTINLKLRPTLLGMRPGTRVVSNSFDMADLEPDRLIESAVGNTRAFLWIVPARIDGAWKFVEVGGKQAFAVQLQQRFQRLEASPAATGKLAVRSGRLLGNQVEIVVDGLDAEPATLTGEVSGDRLLVAVTRAGVTRRYVGSEL